jgi:serine/threonine-protein kinase
MADETLFGRYRLLEPAGTGGMAQVWRALDERTGDEVAVKRLHPLAVADEASRVRLVREFRILRTLDDPSIVPVRDLEVGPRESALILDYVAGPSLAERLTTGPPPSTREALAIVDRVAHALDVAHAAGIVHRDVKPGNVLLDPALGARLTDFGIARDAEDGTAVTAVGTIVGTFGYLGPERLRGEEASAASDVYALGALAWEMLAGRPPFSASTPVGLAKEIAAGPPALGGFPPAVDAVVRRAMAAEPSERPASASTFATELRSAVAGLPVSEASGAPTVVAPVALVAAASVASAEGAPAVPPRRPSARSPRSAGSRPDAVRDRRIRAAASLAALVTALLILAAAVPGGTPRRTPDLGAATTVPSPTGRTATPVPTQVPIGEGGGGGNAKGKGKGKGGH